MRECQLAASLASCLQSCVSSDAWHKVWTNIIARQSTDGHTLGEGGGKMKGESHECPKIVNSFMEDYLKSIETVLNTESSGNKNRNAGDINLKIDYVSDGNNEDTILVKAFWIAKVITDCGPLLR